MTTVAECTVPDALNAVRESDSGQIGRHEGAIPNAFDAAGNGYHSHLAMLECTTSTAGNLRTNYDCFDRISTRRPGGWIQIIEFCHWASPADDQRQGMVLGIIV